MCLCSLCLGKEVNEIGQSFKQGDVKAKKLLFKIVEKEEDPLAVLPAACFLYEYSNLLEETDKMRFEKWKKSHQHHMKEVEETIAEKNS